MTKRQVLLVCAMLTAVAVAAQNNERKLTVDELFGLIETGSRQLQTQKQGEVVASQGVEVAKSQRLPEINSSLSASYAGNVVMTDRHFGDVHGFSSPHFGNSFALEARQVVYAGGAITAGVRMAELQQQQQAAGTELTRQQQRFAALGHYLDLLKIDKRLGVYDENIALTEVLLNHITEMHRQGMALRNDITRYELQMENLRLGRTQLLNQRAITNYQLCQLLGLSTDQTLVADPRTTDGTATPGTLEQWQQQAAACSPQLRQTSLDIETARTGERLARSEQLPQVALVAAESFEGPVTFELPPVDKNLNVWYVGVGVRYAISSLFKGNHKVRQARQTIKRQELAHEARAEQLSNEVQQAWTLWRQSLAELDTRLKSVELAAQNYEVMSERYKNQLSLVTDMVDASNLKLAAEVDVADARVAVAFAYYRLRFVCGML